MSLWPISVKHGTEPRFKFRFFPRLCFYPLAVVSRKAWKSLEDKASFLPFNIWVYESTFCSSKLYLYKRENWGRYFPQEPRLPICTETWLVRGQCCSRTWWAQGPDRAGVQSQRSLWAQRAWSLPSPFPLLLAPVSSLPLTRSYFI